MICSLQSRERELAGAPAGILRDRAAVAGLVARHRFGGAAYSIDGGLTVSHVAGAATAIARTQRNVVHFYQRPDSPLEYDPEATSLQGTMGHGESGQGERGSAVRRELHLHLAGLRNQ